MDRLFTRRQKQILFIEANGKCCICGIELEKGWHADHITPYSKNGETVIENGQALCKYCNLKKTNKIMITQKLRSWQEDFINAIKSYRNQGKKSFLLNAGVGSGKTYATTLASIEFINDDYNVFIVSPGTNIKTRWAEEYLKFGIDINHNYNFLYDYRKNYKGVSVTYHILNDDNVSFLLRNRIITDKTLIILDEVHHSGSELSWGESIKSIGNNSGFLILLSGTPTRSDDCQIPFAKYEPYTEDGKYILKPDYTYSYGDSVKDKICCPVSFRSFDIKAYGVDGMIPEDKPEIMRSAISVKNNDIVYKMFSAADVQLNKLRQNMSDAAGLVICATIEDAKQLYEKIGEEESVIVTSEDDESRYIISDFRDSEKKWIITVKMVSEGVDIPRIRVIVYATNITTRLYFEQAVGRGVRNRDDESLGTIDHCYFYYINFEPLVNNAKQIEDQILHIVEKQEDELYKEYENGANNYEEWPDKYVIYETEIGDMNIINAGVDMTDEFKEFEKDLPHDKWIKLERLLAELKNNNTPKENTFRKPIADRIIELKKKIKLLVGKVYAKTKNRYDSKQDGFSDINIEYNRKAKIFTKQDKDDINKLSLKYELLMQTEKRING